MLPLLCVSGDATGGCSSRVEEAVVPAVGSVLAMYSCSSDIGHTMGNTGVK